MLLDWKAVAGVLGALLAALGLALAAPAAVGWAYGEAAAARAFGGVAVASAVVGGAVWARLRPRDELTVREGLAIVALAWLVLSLVGALPFTLAGVLHRYADAVFETMSGFTTTGATIFGGADTPAIEAMPRAFLFWRSLTHWLGGMGIIVLTLAVMPLLGVGGMQLFKAEVPGPSADKLTPRVRETAKRLWGIYVVLTAAQVLLLLPAMSLFDAVNHAMATLATGGFSTRNGSIGQYQSAYVDAVVTLFMALAGMNFALHYQLLHGRVRRVWRNEELRAYLAIAGVATVLLTLAVWQPATAALPTEVTIEGEVVVTRTPAPATPEGVVADDEAVAPATREGAEAMGGGAELSPASPAGVPDDRARIVRYETLPDAVRYAAFQVFSILTTTGFGTADYELWTPLAQGLLFALFFVGGMAGSTGGGVKVVRVVLILKNSFREFRQLLHPRAILPVRLDHQVVPESILRNVLSFIVLYVGLIGVGTLAMAFLGLDLLSAFSATFSCVGNVGPGFGSFGPTETYTHVPVAGKWVLTLLMMAGRLEIYTVLLLVTRGFWRR